MPEIISRKAMKPRAMAIASGEKYYFTGRPCKQGHISKRIVNGGCCQCNKEASVKWKQSKEGRSHFKEYRRNWMLKNIDQVREKRRIWQQNNPEKCRQSAARNREKMTPERRLECLDQMRAWRLAHAEEEKARYRPGKDRKKKNAQSRARAAKHRAAYIALKELGIQV